MKELHDTLKKEKDCKLLRVRSQIVCLSFVQIVLAVIPPLLLYGFMYKDTTWDSFILWTLLSLACLFFLLHFIVDGRRIFQMFRDKPGLVTSPIAVSKGQPLQDIIETFGQPDIIVVFNKKAIYAYKGIKIFLVNDLVDDVQ